VDAAQRRARLKLKAYGMSGAGRDV
jgi:hypothetical protein